MTIALGGCGGVSSGAPHQGGEHPAGARNGSYGARADALCAMAHKAERALPRPSSRSGFGTYGRRLDLVGRPFLRRLVRLKPPAGRAAEVRRVLKLTSEEVRLDVRLAGALARPRPDRAGLTRLLVRLRATALAENALWHSLGARECAKTGSRRAAPATGTMT